MFKTKCTVRTLVLAMGLLASSSIFAKSTPVNDELSNEDKVRLEQIEERANELLVEVKMLKMAKKEVDTRGEKKAINKQIKEAKNEMKALAAEEEKLSGGIYIGSGAIIVILLLILLL